MPEANIMVVEDESIVALDIKHSLEGLGYAVVAVVSSGENAIQTALETHPDLVLMDIKLKGGLDGVQAAERIRIRHDIPIVYLTAYADEATLKRAKITEPFGYLLKPFEEKELQSTIEMALYKHKMDSKVRESERWLATTLRSIGDAVIATDARGHIKFMNPVAEALTGWGHDEALGKELQEVFKIVDERTRTPALSPAIRALQEGIGVGLDNHTLLITREGTEIPIDDNAAPIRDEKGNITGSVLIFQDVSERVQANAERQRLSAAIEQTAESVIITDTQGRIVYVNPAFEQVTGYSHAEVIGQRPSLLKSGEQDAAFYQEMWETIITGQNWEGRIVNRKKDGSLYTVDTTITPVRSEDGNIMNYVSLQRDVTRELQMEERYRQAQKMEAVGQLTAGIAHDFNNLLTAINGFAELMQLQMAPDTPLYALASKILDSGQRAASLVSQLLAFSRKQIIRPQVMNLNVVVGQMEEMLRRIIGEHIQIEIRLASDLWSVKIDPAQLEQVIVNLAVNARDAMPEGGTLTIETCDVLLDEEYVVEYPELRPGEYVLLAVSDTGVGMSPRVQDHIFEPFFTTKGVGQGTGLGLSTVYGIVKQNGGHITVYSEEGIGSTFKIYLPRTQEAGPTLAPQVDMEDVPVGSETILLVEDDKRVRELTQSAMQRQGYTLLEAQDGEEALQLAASYADPIHLLLTDVVMPGMSGTALAEQLAQSRPGLKTLFMSGYTDEAITHRGVLGPDVPFLQKPFSPADLARKVREVLDS